VFFGIYFFRRDPRLRDRPLGPNFLKGRIHGFFGKSRGRDRKKYIAKKSKKGPFGDVTFSRLKKNDPKSGPKSVFFGIYFFRRDPRLRDRPLGPNFLGPNSRVFREKSGSRPKKIHHEKVEKRPFWGRDFFTTEKKKIQKVGRNPCFSGSIFFDGTLDFATGPSDQTFRRAEFTGFSGKVGVATEKNTLRKSRKKALLGT
jgi:hypothetical protein